jgi:hypothetical protein
LLLDPLGVLHREPERLLLDEMADATRAASILTVIGQGCHRISEIGGRLGQPATSLARPMSRLVDLGFVIRDVPFGATARDSKRSLYRIGDPFLRTWFRFVEPNRSRLALGLLSAVEADLRRDMPHHVGGAWEELARRSVPRLTFGGRTFGPAARYWGRSATGTLTEIDVMAIDIGNPDHVLIGEAKLTCADGEIDRRAAALVARAATLPFLSGKTLTFALWMARRTTSRNARQRTSSKSLTLVTAADVMRVLQ